MNKLRRKNLILAIGHIRDLPIFDEAGDATTFRYAIQAADALVANSLDDERDYLNNMPESFQSGDKGMMAESAIEHMEAAQEHIWEIMDDHSKFDEHEEDIVFALEEAQG